MAVNPKSQRKDIRRGASRRRKAGFDGWEFRIKSKWNIGFWHYVEGNRWSKSTRCESEQGWSCRLALGAGYKRIEGAIEAALACHYEGPGIPWTIECYRDTKALLYGQGSQQRRFESENRAKRAALCGSAARTKKL